MNQPQAYTTKSTIVLGLALIKNLMDESGNVCVSPLSISCALQLALMGADGGTLAQMLQVMGIMPPDRNVLANDCQQLTNYLQSPPQHAGFEGPGSRWQLEIANSIWVDRGIVLRPDYSQALELYNAACNSVDFKDPATVQTINDWVLQQTQGKISNLISQLSSLVYMMLVNCAYFKARWKNEFHSANTMQEPFYLANGGQKTVSMMRKKMSADYFGDEYVQIVELSYTDNRFGMLIVLPSPDLKLKDLCAGMTEAHWHHWRSQLKEHQGQIVMPKFKSEYMITLNEALSRMGMTDAFQQEVANFGNMFQPAAESPQQFWIGKVVHKTFIDVNEEGTEAAAATAISMWGSGGPPQAPPPFNMRVDRPFMFALIEKKTSTILFAGTVVDPQ